MRRRTWIRTLAAGGLAALAGCGSDDGPSETASDNASPGTATPTATRRRTDRPTSTSATDAETTTETEAETTTESDDETDGDGRASRLVALDEKFAPQANVEGAWFGAGLDVSAGTAVVASSAPDPEGAPNVTVFERTGGGWREGTRLVTEQGDPQYAESVAVDGDRIVVGEVGSFAEEEWVPGSAQVYERTGDGWAHRASLENAAPRRARVPYGESIDVDDGTVVVGAPTRSVAPDDDSRALVYTGSGDDWSVEARLGLADDREASLFGRDVAVDDGTVLVGAPFAGDADVGFATVFERRDGAWTRTTRLLPRTDRDPERFGIAVSVSDATALVGRPNSTVADGDDDGGSAFVFERGSGGWRQTAELTDPGGSSGDELGEAVALHGDTALVGAPSDDRAGGLASGTVAVFDRGDDGWTYRETLVASDSAESHLFGETVALDESAMLVGAPFDDEFHGFRSGAVYPVDR